jgi:peptidylglycine monooxygenase
MSSLQLLMMSILLFANVNCQENHQHLDMVMPGVTTTTPDTYMCTGLPIDQDLTFITGFTPLVALGTAHHMWLVACETLDVANSDNGKQVAWLCGIGSAGKGVQQGNMCGPGKNSIIYTWARDAPELVLPADAGFLVGHSTALHFLVVQMHFKNTTMVPDFSGMRLTLTTTPQRHQAGHVQLGHSGVVAPRAVTYLDIACEVTEDIVYRPFAVRSHTHSLGRVSACYLIDRDSKMWTLLTKVDPLRHQMYHPVETEGLVIRKGDQLAARCTMVSTCIYV